jgi:fimbrial isopeptide formation D2 family protein/uncharacterized repeat protein (TIGR01451 family)
MQRKRKQHLLLEQLEERIFLDANPVAAMAVEPDAMLLEPETATEPPPAKSAEPAPTSQPREEQEDSVEQLEEPATPIETSATDESAEEQRTEEENAEASPSSSAAEETDSDGATAQQIGDDERQEPLAETAQEMEAADASPAPSAAEETDSDEATAQQIEDDERQDPLAGAEQVAVETSQVVFVDSSVQDDQQLLAGVAESIDPQWDATSSAANKDFTIGETRVVVLDPAGDQVQQITDTLTGHRGLQGIHIFSHGSDNSLQLGATIIDTANIGSYSDQLRQWGASLNEEGDILLYGCNIALDLTEQSFIQSMADLTGADVAASDDPTGNAASGGDWDLEVSTGLVESRVLKDATDSWNGLLAPPVPTVTVAMPTEGLIEETIDFTVSFDNSAALGDSTNIGYGPYMDVYVPVGLTVTSGPSYSGNAVSFQKFTWDSSLGTSGGAWVRGSTVIDPALASDRHPFDTVTGGRQIPLKVGSHNGDVWYVIELPFGSFTPEQPAAVVNFRAELDEDAVNSTGYSPGDAVVGTPLTVTALGGFRYGADALDNPNADPIIVQASEASDSVTPTLMRVTKTSNAPEGQTATGPNFPVTYTVTVDIAPDQTISNLVLNDYLPSSAYYRDDYVVTGATVNTVDASYSLPTPWQANTSPNNDFFLPLGSVTGNSSDGITEITLTYSVYYGETTANATAVIDPASGDDAVALNEAKAAGTYIHPLGGSQTVTAGDVSGTDGGPGTLDPDGSDHQIELNSITARKSVEITNDTFTPGLSPGDTLTYSIRFEISDYFGFEDIHVVDILGDGQRLSTTYNPQLTVFSNTVTQNSSWDLTTSTNITINRSGIDGKTTIDFDVSGLIGGSGEFYGDLFDGTPGTGPTDYVGRPGNGTYGIITFQAIVEDDYLAVTGDQSVDARDPIDNDVTITGAVLNKDSAVPGENYTSTGLTESDTSRTNLVIQGITSSKGISHINNIPVVGTPAITPGDVVTYRLLMSIPTGSIEDFVLTDYLPLPIYNVAEFGSADFANFLTLESSVDPGSIDLTQGGRIYWGTGTDFQTAPGLVFNSGWVDSDPVTLGNQWKPTTVDTSGPANSLTIDLGTFDSLADRAYQLEILITATVLNNPFADGLYLTNQATWEYNNTFNQGASADGIVQVELLAPKLSITKGVIATDSNQGAFSTGLAESLIDLVVNPPGGDNSLSFVGDGNVSAAEFFANQMNADLSGVDGADLVTFAISVANSGASAAHGLQVRDTLPEGFVIPTTGLGLNLQVWRGDGTKLVATTDYTLGAEGLFDLDGTAGNDGITFLTPLDGDRLGLVPDGTVGDDIFIITYDLQVDNETVIDAYRVQAGSTHTNTASIAYFTGKASDVGNPNSNWIDPNDPPQDEAATTIATPTIAKTLVGTEITAPGNNLVNQATIGELVTYRITLTVPEGQMGDVILRDTLDNGLAFVGVTSVPTLTAGLSYSGSTTPVIGAAGGQDGRLITFNLGQVTNTNSSNSTAETIVIEYQAVVLNTNGAAGSANNQAGQLRNNSLDIDWHNGAGIQDLEDVFAANITIVEPTLSVAKLVANQTDGTTFQASVPGDSGDTIQYRITITNGNAAGDTTAFDISLADVIPASLGSLSIVSAIAGGTGTVSFTGAGSLVQAFQLSGNTLGVLPTANIDMQKNSTITITVQGTFSGATGDVIPNTAEVRWTSMDGDVQNRTGNNDASDERDGSSGLLGSTGTLNDYRVQGTATITSPSLVYKAIVATSEASTAQSSIVAADAAVGEIVRYRLYASIGEGTTNNFQIQDNLPEGTRFLNDGSARWTFIASGGNMTSTGITNISELGDTTVLGNGATLASLASTSITGTFADNNIATAFSGAGTGDVNLYASGQDVFFRFGNIVNSDRDTDLEFVVVEFNALVENISTNEARGQTRANNFTVLADTQLSGDGVPGYISVMIDNDGSGTRSLGDTTVNATDTDNNADSGDDTPAWSNEATLTLVEPHLIIDKSVTATTGAVVTYQVVLTNSGTATAFGATLTDILPSADLDLLVGSIAIVPAGGATTGTADHNDTANRMRFTSLDIPVGGTITVTYQANVLTTTSGATAIENTAATTWTSLPGDQGTAGSSGFFGTTAGSLGATGTSTGERNGSDGIGGALNDYAASDNVRLGSLGDRVYFDADGDGVQDGSEPGLVGVTVTVRWEGADGIFGNGDDSVISVTTGADGIWTVAGLPLGNGQDYRVSVPASTGGMTLTDVRDNGAANTNPDGLGVGISAITLTGIDATTTNNRLQDFGYRGSASLGDRVYIDADGDGVQDNNGREPSLPGVGVILTWAGLDGDINTTGDNLTFTTTTNPASPGDPNYLFQYLPAGNYTVAVSASGGSGGVPDNMVLTDSVDDTFLSATATVTTSLTEGETKQTIDFGYRGNSAIGDRVWYDADGDGLQVSGEPGIPGVQVTLLWSGPDGTLGNADDVTFTTTTDANGNYLFSGLPVNGDNDPYRVTVSQPALFPEQTYDSDDIDTPNQSTLALPQDTSNLDQDFGYRGSALATAQLGNLVWEDLNGNGRQDAGEPGIDGVTVELFYAGADGVFQPEELATPLLTTLTTDSGTYQFNNLVAGTYAVRFGTSDGTTSYARTIQDSPVADDANDSDADGATGYTGNYTLNINEDNTTVDAGLYQPVTLGDRIYYDLDRDGVQDPGEPGIANIPVEVIWFGPDGVLGGGDDLTFTTISGANGIWNLNNLPPGSYQVTARPPADRGYILTDSLDNGALDTTNPVVLVTTSGAVRNDIDFGLSGTGSVGDTIWNDRDRDGIQDPGEPGIGGVGVTIGIDLNGDGAPDFTTSTTTDAGGQYIFDNLPAGSHIIRIDPATLPPGIRPSFDPDGVLDGTFTVRLGPGENNRDVDFGYAFPPPGQPGGSLTPPPPGPPVEPAGLVIDAFFMHRQFGEEQFPFDRWLEISYPMPPLPVSPIYTGLAEPGTTLVLTIYDSAGNQIGNQTIMADTAGNWLASFPGTLLSELPHDMAIAQQSSLYNSSSPGLFNMRTYFNPNFTSMVHSSAQLDVATIFAYLPSTLMESVHMSNLQSFDIGWDSFKSYEFNTTSINPARTGH